MILSQINMHDTHYELEKANNFKSKNGIDIFSLAQM